eukprot:COSAG01_NODE_41570_length_449_cov_13.831429_2_plen_20_part_01
MTVALAAWRELHFVAPQYRR